MTVSTEISREHYVGNGKTTVFDYRFRIFSHGDLRVEIADTQNQLTPLTLNTDFTVLSSASEQGGKIQLKKPLAENWHITIERQLPVTQETDLRNQGHFFPEVHEDVFDKLTMLIQQVIGKWGLELRKPSWLANYFDARQQRIIKLAGPVDAEDAATKGYADTLDAKTSQHVEALNSATNTRVTELDKATNERVGQLHADISDRALRAPEANISPIPTAAVRAGKLLSFDALGAPIAALPPTGTAADVLTELAKSDGATKIGSRKHSVQQALDEKFDKTGGTVNGDIISQGTQIGLKGDNRKHFILANADGKVRAYIWKDKGGDGIHINNGIDGGGEYVFHKDGGFRAPSSVYAGTARMAADGNVVGSKWGNQWLDVYLKNTFQPKGAYGQTNTAKREVNGWWKCGDTGLIIQWARYGKGQVGTYDFPLPMKFPKAGLFCLGYVGTALGYDADGQSQSAHLVDNATVMVTIDNGLESVVLAIGF